MSHFVSLNAAPKSSNNLSLLYKYSTSSTPARNIFYCNHPLGYICRPTSARLFSIASTRLLPRQQLLFYKPPPHHCLLLLAGCSIPRREELVPVSSRGSTKKPRVAVLQVRLPCQERAHSRGILKLAVGKLPICACSHCTPLKRQSELAV